MRKKKDWHVNSTHRIQKEKLKKKIQLRLLTIGCVITIVLLYVFLNRFEESFYPKGLQPAQLTWVNQEDESIKHGVRIEKVHLSNPLFRNYILTIELTWSKEGDLPFRDNNEAVLYILDHLGEPVKEQVVDIDLTKISKNESVVTKTNINFVGIADGNYRIGIAIIDKDTKTPTVTFMMDNRRKDKIYPIASYKVNLYKADKITPEDQENIEALRDRMK